MVKTMETVKRLVLLKATREKWSELNNLEYRILKNLWCVNREIYLMATKYV